MSGALGSCRTETDRGAALEANSIDCCLLHFTARPPHIKIVVLKSVMYLNLELRRRTTLTCESFILPMVDLLILNRSQQDTL